MCASILRSSVLPFRGSRTQALSSGFKIDQAVYWESFSLAWNSGKDINASTPRNKCFSIANAHLIWKPVNSFARQIN